MELRRERERERWREGEMESRTERERETDTRVKDLLASGVTSKRTRGYTLTFGGTEGSILGRREWFDAVSKGFV